MSVYSEMISLARFTSETRNSSHSQKCHSPMKTCVNVNVQTGISLLISGTPPNFPSAQTDKLGTFWRQTRLCFTIDEINIEDVKRISDTRSLIYENQCGCMNVETSISSLISRTTPNFPSGGKLVCDRIHIRRVPVWDEFSVSDGNSTIMIKIRSMILSTK